MVFLLTAYFSIFQLRRPRYGSPASQSAFFPTVDAKF